MRPPESFSTAATKRLSHSCCVSLIVAVLSFMTKVLPPCACATGGSVSTVARAVTVHIVVSKVVRFVFIFPSGLGHGRRRHVGPPVLVEFDQHSFFASAA